MHTFTKATAAAAIAFAGLGTAHARTLVLDHFVVSKGTTSSQVEDAFQYQIMITNAGGLGNAGAGGSATVELFLFNDDGTPTLGQSGNPICGNGLCKVTVPAGTKARFNLDALAEDNAGGLNGAGTREVTTGFAILTVEGAGAAETNASAFFVNIHDGAFNLSPVVLNAHEVSERRAPVLGLPTRR